MPKMASANILFLLSIIALTSLLGINISPIQAEIVPISWEERKWIVGSGFWNVTADDYMEQNITTDYHWIYTETEASSYDIEANLLVKQGGKARQAKLVFMNANSNQYREYTVSLRTQLDLIYLHINGSLVDQQYKPLSDNIWYHVRVSVTSTNIKVYIDSGTKPIFDLNGSFIPDGNVGIATWSANAQFNNFNLYLRKEEGIQLFWDDFNDNYIDNSLWVQHSTIVSETKQRMEMGGNKTGMLLSTWKKFSGSMIVSFDINFVSGQGDIYFYLGKSGGYEIRFTIRIGSQYCGLNGSACLRIDSPWSEIRDVAPWSGILGEWHNYQIILDVDRAVFQDRTEHIQLEYKFDAPLIGTNLTIGQWETNSFYLEDLLVVGTPNGETPSTTTTNTLEDSSTQKITTTKSSSTTTIWSRISFPTTGISFLSSLITLILFTIISTLYRRRNHT